MNIHYEYRIFSWIYTCSSILIKFSWFLSTGVPSWLQHNWTFPANPNHFGFLVGKCASTKPAERRMAVGRNSLPRFKILSRIQKKKAEDKRNLKEPKGGT